MTTFFDLFMRNAAGPESRADPTWADRQLPALVAESPFRLWHPGDPIPEHGLRLLIGVATWSGFDMRLLDVLADVITRRAAKDEVVELFNTADCNTPPAFRRYIPKLHNPSQTPYVGIWRDGVLDWSGQGHSAREQVARMFGSGSDEIVEYVRARIQPPSPARGV
jgi:hypothetical protein